MLAFMRSRLKNRGLPLLLDQVLMSGTNFLILYLAAKVLSPEALAAYTLANTVLLFLLSVNRVLIIQPASIFFVSQQYRGDMSVFSRALPTQTIFVLLGISAIFAFGFVYFPDVRILLSLSIYFVVTISMEFYRRILISTGRAAEATSIFAISGLICVALVSCVWYLKIEGPHLVFAAGFSGICIAYAIKHKSIYKISTSLISGIKTKNASGGRLQYIKYAKWLVLSQLVFFGATQIYPFIISDVLDARSVAIYAVCGSIVNIINVARLAIANHLPAYFSARKSELSVAEFKGLAGRVTFLAVFGLILVNIVLCFLAPTIFSLLFGDKYTGASSFFPLLLFAQLPSFISLFLNSVSMAVGDTKQIFFGNLFGTIFSLAIGPEIVGKLGLTGVALGVAVSAFFPMAFQLIAFARLKNLEVHRGSNP